MENNLNSCATSFYPWSSICQHFLLMISFFSLKLLYYADCNAIYSLHKNADIVVVNRLRHDWFYKNYMVFNPD